MNDIPELPDRIVAIKHSCRSGSRFFHSLLDGHPEIMMIPSFYNHFHAFWESHGALPAEELIESFVAFFPVFFRESQNDGFWGMVRLGADQDESLGVEQALFIDGLERYLEGEGPITRRQFFLASHYAYHHALGRDFDSLKTIVYYFHNPTEAHMGQLLEDFPETVFIHLLRAPLEGLHSCFRMYFHQKDHFLQDRNLPGFVLKVMLFTGRTKLEIRNTSRIRGVRMEDLIMDPERTLGQVCEYLGLRWNDRLLDTTLDGMKFWYPRAGNEGLITGFETKMVTPADRNSENRYMNRFDALRLKILMGRKHEKWGYELNPWYRSLLFRILLLPMLLPTFRMERAACKERFSDFRAVNTLVLSATLLLMLAVSPFLMVVSLFRPGRRVIKKKIPGLAFLWLSTRTTLLRAWFLLFENGDRDIELLAEGPGGEADGPWTGRQ